MEAVLDNMRRIVRRIEWKYDRVEFCYEASPTGYGLHRMIVSLTGMPGRGAVADPQKVMRPSQDQRDAVALASR